MGEPGCRVPRLQRAQGRSDTSGSMHFILDAEQDAASSFVHEVMRKKDEAIILSFDTDVNLLADFTEDPQVLRRAIRRASPAR